MKSLFKQLIEYAKKQGVVTRQELVAYGENLKPHLHLIQIETAVVTVLSSRKTEPARKEMLRGNISVLSYLHSPYYFVKDGDKFTYCANNKFFSKQLAWFGK